MRGSFAALRMTAKTNNGKNCNCLTQRARREPRFAKENRQRLTLARGRLPLGGDFGILVVGNVF